MFNTHSYPLWSIYLYEFNQNRYLTLFHRNEGEGVDEPEWIFDYQALIDSINHFAKEIDSPDFIFMWKYTQKMVKAHGLAIAPPYIPEEEATAIAWSQFEDTFDDDESSSIISLAGIIAALVSTVPEANTTQFHRALEVGFARARGFSAEDAEAQHLQWLNDNPDFLSLLKEEEKRFRVKEREKLKAKFTIIDGGKTEL
jgi:hypothetical protein